MSIFEKLATRFSNRKRKRQQAALAKRVDALRASADFHRDALEALSDFDDGVYGRPRACGADVPYVDAYQTQVTATAALIIQAGRRSRGLPPVKMIDRFGREVGE